jgi:type I restriction enzyme S subunit
MGNILKNIDYIPKAHERHWISIFSNFDVLIPQNIEEQQKIGSYFKQLDQLISISEQELNGYKELKKSMMQKLFSQEVRFKRDDGSDYPDWEEKAFNTIFIEYNNKNSNGYSQYTAGKYGLKLIDEEKIRYDISKHKSFHKNTLILGIGIEEVGVSIDIDGCVSPIYTTFDIVNADSKFISYFIKQCFDKNKGKITHKSTRRDYEFETKELSSLNIYLPKSIEEQQKIGLYFNQLDNLISITMQELNEYKRLKKCMLQKMFC